MFTFPIGHFSVSGTGFLDDVISSVVVDLDATLSDSYGGSGQTLANVIAFPADSSAQTDYDFFRGLTGDASTDDPTFVGSAGDPAAHFLFDGGDIFKLVAGSNPSLFKDMHKTTGGPDFWLAVAFRYVEAGDQTLFVTAFSSNFIPQIRIKFSGTDTAEFRQVGDGSQAIQVTHGTFTTSTDFLLIISHKHSTNKTRFWLNTTTNTEVGQIFKTTTTDPDDTPGLFARGNGGQPMANNTRFYGFYAGNEFLDDTKATDIIDHICTRHNRNYTGSCL